LHWKRWKKPNNSCWRAPDAAPDRRVHRRTATASLSRPRLPNSPLRKPGRAEKRASPGGRGDRWVRRSDYGRPEYPGSAESGRTEDRYSDSLWTNEPPTRFGAVDTGDAFHAGFHRAWRCCENRVSATRGPSHTLLALRVSSSEVIGPYRRRPGPERAAATRNLHRRGASDTAR
jgi:hypothetical protein